MYFKIASIYKTRLVEKNLKEAVKSFPAVFIGAPGDKGRCPRASDLDLKRIGSRGKERGELPLLFDIEKEIPRDHRRFLNKLFSHLCSSEPKEF